MHAVDDMTFFAHLLLISNFPRENFLYGCVFWSLTSSITCESDIHMACPD